MHTVTPLSDNFMPWREEVDRLLLRNYFVDLKTAGIDDQFLFVHYEMDQIPSEFVEWFATKYDLIDFR